MSRKQFARLFAAPILAVTLFGQTAATLDGIVKDKAGKPVGGVKLLIVGIKTAERRTAVSAPDGGFRAPQIPPDSYQVTLSCDTCADMTTSVEIGAGQTRHIDLQVETESATTVVAVDTKATTMELSSARLGSNISAAEISELPVNGRTYGPLALGAPGASNAGAGGFSDIRFQGQSIEQNSFRLDGIDVSGVVSASPGFTAAPGFQFRLRTSVDTIQEFRVDSATYPASQGGATGGQVNLVSKAGENEWHGSLFEFLRNEAVDARNFFDDGRSELRLNQYGGSAGGDLVKNKLFLFGSFEQLRQRAGLHVLEHTPSAETLESGPPELAFLETVLPSGTPVGDGELAAAVRGGVARQDETSFSVRLDYVPNDGNRFFLRAQRASGDLDTPDATVSPRSVATALRSDHLVASWNRTMGNLVNELVAGVNRTPTTMTVNGGAASLAGFRIFAGEQGGGVVSPGGLAVLPDGDYGSRAEFRGRSYEINDHMTLLYGAHTFKAGVESRTIRVPIELGGGSSYLYQDVAGVMQNEDADVTYIGDLPFHVAAQQQYGGYVQDEWRPAAGLTLNLGVRYEYYSPTREVNDRGRLFDLTAFQYKPVHGGFYEASRLGFNPRFGLAWAPGRFHGNTVIRFGAGSYQGPFSLADTIQPIENDTTRLLLLRRPFPFNPADIESISDVRELPLGMDPSSYRHNTRNYQVSLSLQQALPGKFVGQASFVGSVARHLTQIGAVNPVVYVDPLDGYPHRKDENLGGIAYTTSGGRSSYNALELGVSRRFVDGLTFSASYNWAHSIGTTEGAGDAAQSQDPACLSCERASTSFDARHSLNASFVYDLPFGTGNRRLNSGVIGRIAKGWTVAGSYNYRTGLPVNVTINRPDEIFFDPATGTYYPGSAELPETAYGVMNVPGGGEGRPALRPDLVPGVDPYLRDKSSGQWLNPTAFAAPMPGKMGNLGRNALRGPGFAQADLQISRRFSLTEHKSITFRAEAFNLLNHANFANPPAVLQEELEDIPAGQPYSVADAGSFGRLSSTLGKTVGLGTSRQIQFGLRFQF